MVVKVEVSSDAHWLICDYIQIVQIGHFLSPFSPNCLANWDSPWKLKNKAFNMGDAMLKIHHFERTWKKNYIERKNKFHGKFVLIGQIHGGMSKVLLELLNRKIQRFLIS